MLYGCAAPVNPAPSRAQCAWFHARAPGGHMIDRPGISAARIVLRLLLLAAAFGAVTAPTAAVAQSVSGTILGTVTDPSGAIVADAKVTVINEGTGLTRTVTSDRNGEYVVPSIPTGRYTVTAEVAGFK